MYSLLIDPGHQAWPLCEKEHGPSLGQLIIGIKGAGEMATGIAWRLFQSNFRNIFMMEIANPLAVRRMVSFCEAVHDGAITVEGVEACSVSSYAEIPMAWKHGRVPVIVDPTWSGLDQLQPHIVIDAILAKKNLGTRITDADLVIGLGPGFEAGRTVHNAIETNRGHNLGRVLKNGCPEPNTGVPGSIGGYTIERVLRAPCAGIFQANLPIGTHVKCNDIVATVNGQPVVTRINGIVRGLIRDNTRVVERMKIGDIDPRGDRNNCVTISEKARAIGGSVLESILGHYNL